MIDEKEKICRDLSGIMICPVYLYKRANGKYHISYNRIHTDLLICGYHQGKKIKMQTIDEWMDEVNP